MFLLSLSARSVDSFCCRNVCSYNYTRSLCHTQHVKVFRGHLYVSFTAVTCKPSCLFVCQICGLFLLWIFVPHGYGKHATLGAIVTHNDTTCSLGCVYVIEFECSSTSVGRDRKPPFDSPCGLIDQPMYRKRSSMDLEGELLGQLSRPQTINLYDGFVCHDDVIVVASTTDYRLGRSD